MMTDTQIYDRITQDFTMKYPDALLIMNNIIYDKWKKRRIGLLDTRQLTELLSLMEKHYGRSSTTVSRDR